ncbi:MAG: DUF4349 domain-containing protein [Bacteroidales bacterium]|nr:DUF4349 domain-containing protein [Bacteroidales bacterium]
MKKNVFILSVLILFLFSCNKDYSSSNYIDDDGGGSNTYSDNTLSKDYYYEEEVLVDDLAATGQSIPPDNQQTNTPTSTDQTAITADELSKIGRKVIRNGDVSLELSDYEVGIKQIKDTLNSFDCEIISEAENNYSSYITNTIVISVKSSQFDSLLSAVLSGDGRIISKNIYANDVTQQYVDVYIRLKNKRAVAEQYREILKRAYTINDILNVQQYLRQIEEEIEVSEGQLFYWDQKSDFSTLTLTITYYGEQTPVAKDTFWSNLLEGLEMGWDGLLFFLLVIVRLWPLWFLAGIIIFVVLRQIKKQKAKNAIKK